MKTTSKNYPDWVEDLPDDNKAQPWGVYDQGPFVSVRQRDGSDSDTIHWVLIHKDEIEGFIEQVRSAPIITPQPHPQDTALRIASVADIDNYLDIGTEVHWKGQKFEFDGVVERIETDDIADGEGWINYDTKVLFIRSNNTGKLVSLNMRDIQTGRLTLID